MSLTDDPEMILGLCENEFEITVMQDNEPRFVCTRCHVKYKKLSLLRSHLKECGIGAKCPLCPKIVTQRRNLKKHMETHVRYDNDVKKTVLNFISKGT